MRLECALGHWDFKVLFSALPLLHSSFKMFSFLKPILPISVEIAISPYQFVRKTIEDIK